MSYPPTGAAPEEWVEHQRAAIMDAFRRLHQSIELVVDSGDLQQKIDAALAATEQLEHKLIEVRAVQGFCEEYLDDEDDEEEDDEG